MKKDIRWVVTRIDGKIASVCADFRHLPRIADQVNRLPEGAVNEIVVSKVGMDELVALSARTGWDDMKLFGTPFQLDVWHRLYLFTHHEDGTPILPDEGIKLLSYSQLADLCGNPRGVRAVAHAVACNPVAYIIPCHLIVPKEAIDKILAIRTVAEGTIFKGTDLYLLDSIEVGEYEYGSALKRRVIERQLYGR
ncbi:MAG: MGMT family protein [Bacteroidales bacterium]|nr:MGMT family protein [Bacteroidales bacterium]